MPKNAPRLDVSEPGEGAADLTGMSSWIERPFQKSVPVLPPPVARLALVQTVQTSSMEANASEAATLLRVERSQ